MFLHEMAIVEATPGNKMILECLNSKYLQKTFEQKNEEAWHLLK